MRVGRSKYPLLLLSLHINPSCILSKQPRQTLKPLAQICIRHHRQYHHHPHWYNNKQNVECVKLESLRMELYMNHFRPCRLCWNKLVLVVVVAIALCWSQKKGEVTLIIMRPWSAGVVCSWFSRSSSSSRLRPRHRCDRWLPVSCETEKNYNWYHYQSELQ